MDLSKAFNCIPHDLLIAKLYAYGLDFDTVTFLHNYLKHQKQSAKIDNISSFSRTILLGVPQGSVLGPILFNTFINDLLLWLTKSDLHNFADDNAIAVTCKNLNDLLHALEKESESTIDWLRSNIMIGTPDKLQAIIMNKRRENQITQKLKIHNNEIKTTKSIKLLGIEIDHVSKLCSKAAMQINAICRLAKFMGNKVKIAMINSFVYSNFNYCPLVYNCKSDYGNLIKNNDTTTMEIKRLQTLATKIFKIININPSYMKNIFTPKTKVQLLNRT